MSSGYFNPNRKHLVAKWRTLGDEALIRAFEGMHYEAIAEGIRNLCDEDLIDLLGSFEPSDIARTMRAFDASSVLEVLQTSKDDIIEDVFDDDEDTD